MPELSPDTKGVIYRVLLNELVRDKTKMNALEELAGKEARVKIDQEVDTFLTWLKISAGY